MVSPEQIINLISLVIALASLAISVIALILTRKVYFLSSKDYIPEITFSLEKESFELVNKSADLFELSSINILKIDTFGFEDHGSGNILEVSFVTKSKVFRWFDKQGKEKKVRFSFDSPGPCAYLCPYNEDLVNQVADKITEEYSLDSEKGYALPSIRSVCYIVEVLYKNRFLELKSVIYKYQHFHGSGFEKFKITEEELSTILDKANIPKFDSFEDLWYFLFSKGGACKETLY